MGGRSSKQADASQLASVDEATSTAQPSPSTTSAPPPAAAAAESTDAHAMPKEGGGGGGVSVRDARPTPPLSTPPETADGPKQGEEGAADNNNDTHPESASPPSTIDMETTAVVVSADDVPSADKASDTTEAVPAAVPAAAPAPSAPTDTADKEDTFTAPPTATATTTTTTATTATASANVDDNTTGVAPVWTTPLAHTNVSPTHAVTLLVKCPTGWDSVRLHFSADGSEAWTPGPSEGSDGAMARPHGVPMYVNTSVASLQYAAADGWLAAVVPARSVTFCMTDGAGQWDNNGGANHVIESPGVYTLTDGVLHKVDNVLPEGVKAEDETQAVAELDALYTAGENNAVYSSALTCLREGKAPVQGTNEALAWAQTVWPALASIASDRAVLHHPVAVCMLLGTPTHPLTAQLHAVTTAVCEQLEAGVEASVLLGDAAAVAHVTRTVTLYTLATAAMALGQPPTASSSSFKKDLALWQRMLRALGPSEGTLDTHVAGAVVCDLVRVALCPRPQGCFLPPVATLLGPLAGCASIDDVSALVAQHA